MCPFCGFARNLANHIDTEHPEFAAELDAYDAAHGLTQNPAERRGQ
jgi:hypothetical protein